MVSRSDSLAPRLHSVAKLTVSRTALRRTLITGNGVIFSCHNGKLIAKLGRGLEIAPIVEAFFLLNLAIIGFYLLGNALACLLVHLLWCPEASVTLLSPAPNLKSTQKGDRSQLAMAISLHHLHASGIAGLQTELRSSSLTFTCSRQLRSNAGCCPDPMWRQNVAVSSKNSAPNCKYLKNMSLCHASLSADTATVSSDHKNEDSIPVLKFTEVAERIQSLTATRPQTFRAMYSSVIGGITTDPAAMFIPIDDHMVHRGHGVFDTAIIYNGCLYELDVHLDRLLRSAATSKIKSPVDRAALRHILVQTVAASGCRRGSLRYWLSAGLGGFGLSSKECYKSTFYAIVTDVTYQGPEGVKVVTSTIPIKPPFFATVKSVNYLPNVLAQLEAEEMGTFTAIWLDNEGFIAEGPNMNVAVLGNDGVLLIPPFDTALAGCTARRVLELVPELMKKKLVAGLVGAKVQRLSVQKAKSASEMMLIGSGVLVKSIIEWDGVPVGNGKVGALTTAIREAMQSDLEDPSAGKLVVVPYTDGL